MVRTQNSENAFEGGSNYPDNFQEEMRLFPILKSTFEAWKTSIPPKLREPLRKQIYFVSSRYFIPLKQSQSQTDMVIEVSHSLWRVPLFLEKINNGIEGFVTQSEVTVTEKSGPGPCPIQIYDILIWFQMQAFCVMSFCMKKLHGVRGALKPLTQSCRTGTPTLLGWESALIGQEILKGM